MIINSRLKPGWGCGAMELDALGIYPILLLGGFLGSLAYIAAQPGPPKNWWEIISPIFSAVPAANYLSHFAVGYFFGEALASGTGAGCGAFLIGAGGPLTARAIMRRWSSWSPSSRSTST